jgi:uncharacterized membrane protein
MSRKMKWLVTGLCVSVGLNLLVAGVIIARVTHHGPMFGMGQVHMDRMMGRLSEPAQDVLRGAMRNNRPILRGHMYDLHESHKNVTRLLAEETLNEEALNEAFAQLRQTNEDIQATLQTVIISVAQDLPPEERVKLARGGMRLLRHMEDRHLKDRPRPQGPMGASGPGMPPP